MRLPIAVAIAVVACARTAPTRPPGAADSKADPSARAPESGSSLTPLEPEQGAGQVIGVFGRGTVGRGGGSGSFATHAGLASRPSTPTSRRVNTIARVDPRSPADRFRDVGLNPFVDPQRDRASTFAVDVDTASYTIVRRMLAGGVVPPPFAVRPEELINYFDYDYSAPKGGSFAVHLDAAPSPFSPGMHVLRVGVQARRIAPAERKPTHLTFLVDVSGSMRGEDRLPLARAALHLLVDGLRDGDTVALVTYAGNVRRVLAHTGMSRRAEIHAAIDALSAYGSTAMSSGIELAYEEARRMVRPGEISRVIVLSDGDANVGADSHEAILDAISHHVRYGVTLTTVGFGMGNYRDDLMEQLADRGDGNSYYVDSLAEARRIFQDRVAGTLEVVAKDVKLQVVFDPRQVRRYRLVGYENRDVADHEFRDDGVDGGEIGAGHSATALYEVELHPGAGAGLARVHVRAKDPEAGRAVESAFDFEGSRLARAFDAAPADLRLATAVMGFAERLRGSAWAMTWRLDEAEAIARAAGAPELAELIGRYDALAKK